MADPAPTAPQPPIAPARSGSASRESTTSPQLRNMATANSTGLSHRSSFANEMRPHPPSPRTPRHPSFTQAAVQELINHPQNSRPVNPRFAGRDWRQIPVGEVVDKSRVRFVDLSTTVEEATKLLIESGAPHVVLIRSPENSLAACDTFDYNDLNAYLLVVLGLATPDAGQVDRYTEIANKARERRDIPLKDIVGISSKAPIVTLSEVEDLSRAIEIFAGGVHRILVVQHGTDNVVGVFSQFTALRFLWDNAGCFPVIDQLYPVILRDLNIGTQNIISINGDKTLTEALRLMNEDCLTSVAVVDNAMNVIGNISTADVKHLTNISSLPLLKSSCLHFISVILSERGVENGKDSFPVFHVNPYSTLAHTTAKLIATKAHRMWVVEGSSPSPSTPATPAATPAVNPVMAAGHTSTPASPSLNAVFPTISGQTGVSGRLTGVITLTDILNLFARQSGLQPSDPNEQRQRRRRSSSSSMRASVDFGRAARASFDIRR